MKKKLLSWLLVAALVITMIPGSAFASVGGIREVEYIDSAGNPQKVQATVIDSNTDFVEIRDNKSNGWFYAEPNKTITLSKVGNFNPHIRDMKLIVGDGAKVIFPHEFRSDNSFTIYAQTNNKTGIVEFSATGDSSVSVMTGTLGIYGVTVKSNGTGEEGFRIASLNIINGGLEISNKTFAACIITKGVSTDRGKILIKDCYQGIQSNDMDNAKFEFTDSDIDITYTDGMYGLTADHVLFDGGTVDITKTGPGISGGMCACVRAVHDVHIIHDAVVNCKSTYANTTPETRNAAVIADYGYTFVNFAKLNVDTAGGFGVKTKNFLLNAGAVTAFGSEYAVFSSTGKIIVLGGSLEARNSNTTSSAIIGDEFCTKESTISDNMGNAIIKTNKEIYAFTKPQGYDKDAEWSGVISEDDGKNYKVYGNPNITLATLTIEPGQTLRVPAGHTLSLGREGKIINKGGTIINEGTINATNGEYEGTPPQGDYKKPANPQAQLVVKIQGVTRYGEECTLTTDGGSGTGEVTYHFSEPEKAKDIATINGDKITFKKTGKVTIFATKNGDGTYKEVSSDPREITIAEAVITGDMDKKQGTKVYTGEPIAPDMDFSQFKTKNGQPIDVKYGTKEGEYTLSKIPEYKDAGKYIIYYQVSALYHRPIKGSYTFTIEPCTPKYDAQPELKSRTDKSITLKTIKVANYTVQYRANDNRGKEIPWQDSVTFNNLEPGVEYTFETRIVPTNNNREVISLNKARIMTLFSALDAEDMRWILNTEYTKEVLYYDENTYEVNKKADFSAESKISDGASIKDIIGKDIYVRQKARKDIPESMTAVFHMKSRPATPAAPTASLVKDTSVTLKAVTGALYKCNDGEWQNSPEFTGLTANTKYRFTQKIAATRTDFASEESTAEITTNKVSLENARIDVIGEFTYNKAAHTPSGDQVKVYLGEQLVDATEYDISYENNKDAGNATIKVTAKPEGNYLGVATGSFIIKKAIIDVSNWEWQEAKSFVFDKEAKTVSIKAENAGFDKVDLKYIENSATNAGKYTATVTATPKDKKNYKVEGNIKAFSWEITKKPISAVSINITQPKGKGIPDKSISGEGYNVAITWKGELKDNLFDYNKKYVANIVITPDKNYEFTKSTTVDLTDNEKLEGSQIIASKEYTTAKAKITSVTNPIVEKFTEHFTSKGQALDKMPKTIKITAEDGTTELPLSWTIAEYNSKVKAENTFSWSANADGFDINNQILSGTVTVANIDAIPVKHEATDKKITYSDKGFDVKTLFKLDKNAGQATYSIVEGESTGAGSLGEKDILTIAKAGVIKIKVSTDANGEYGAGQAIATLTIDPAKATGKPKGKFNKPAEERPIKVSDYTITTEGLTPSEGEIIWTTPDKEVKVGEAYEWKFMPKDKDKYAETTGTIVLKKPTPTVPEVVKPNVPAIPDQGADIGMTEQQQAETDKTISDIIAELIKPDVKPDPEQPVPQSPAEKETAETEKNIVDSEKNNKYIKISVETEKISADKVPAEYQEDVKKLEEAVSKELGKATSKVIQNADINVSAHAVDVFGTSTPLGNLNRLDKKISFTIQLPNDTTGTNFGVARVYDGKVEFLPLSDLTYDETTKTITFKADKFGTYAVFKYDPNAPELKLQSIDRIENHVFAGIAITPEIVVRNGKGDVLAKDAYTVTWKNNDKIGTAKVIVKAKEGTYYKGTLEESFLIVPETVKNIKIKTDYSLVKVTFDKSVNAKSYRIAYRYVKDGKYGKWTYVNTRSNSVVIKKLYKGIGYDIRVAAVDGKVRSDYVKADRLYYTNRGGDRPAAMKSARIEKAYTKNGAVKLTARNIKYITSPQSVKYKFAYRVKGTKTWKYTTYSSSRIKTIKGLKKGKTYTFAVAYSYKSAVDNATYIYSKYAYKNVRVK